MKFPAGTFEAVIAKKEKAVGESSRPAKKARRREPTRSSRAPTALPVPEKPAEKKPEIRAVQGPAGAETEEGEIPATTEPMVVVLDEEDAPAAADVPEAGQGAVVVEPPAVAEPEKEGVQPPPTEGERVVKEPRAGEAEIRKFRRKPELSLQPRAGPVTGRRVEGAHGESLPVPILPSIWKTRGAAVQLSSLRTSESDEEVRGMSHGDILDMMLATTVQMGTGALALRDAVAESSNALSRALFRAEEFRKEGVAQAQSLARLHQESQAREESLGTRLREAESRASAAEARLELASEKLTTAGAQNEELARRLRRAVEEAQAAAEIAAAAEKAAVEAGSEKAGAVAYADEANARAEEAGNRASEAEAGAQQAEAKAQQAEAKAQEAEARAQRAEAETQEAKAEAQRAKVETQEAKAEAGLAVSKYKASPDFEQEVLEASLDAYFQGFERCKVRVSEVLKVDSSALEGIRPNAPGEDGAEAAEEEEREEEEEDGGEPGPEEP